MEEMTQFVYILSYIVKRECMQNVHSVREEWWIQSYRWRTTFEQRLWLKMQLFSIFSMKNVKVHIMKWNVMAYCEIKFSSCRGLFDNLGPVKPLATQKNQRPYMAFGSFEWPKAWRNKYLNCSVRLHAFLYPTCQCRPIMDHIRYILVFWGFMVWLEISLNNK